MSTSHIVRPATSIEGSSRQGQISKLELERFATDRIQNALRRFEHRIDSVSVILDDVNGPRGGVDQRCRIELRLHRKGRIVVSATAESAHAAIAKAAARIRSAVVRRLERRLSGRATKTVI